jgi:fatty acid desaturase
MNNSPDRLIEPADLQALMKRNNRDGLVRILLHSGLIALVGMMLAASETTVAYVSWTLVLGLFLIFLFAPVHETIHKTAFDSPALNTIVGFLAGLVILLPPRYFQAFHMAHHRHTQVEGKDPELDTPKPATRLQYLYLMSGIPHWIDEISVIVSNAAGKNRPRFVREDKYPGVVREARLFIAIYTIAFIATWMTGSTFLLVYWVIPMIVGQPFLRGFLLAEHTLCPLVPGMLENTRTTMTNPPARWLCWNMNYHVEHHAYPAIPFHRLPATHDQLKQHITHLDPGYIRVNRKIVSALAK